MPPEVLLKKIKHRKFYLRKNVMDLEVCITANRSQRGPWEIVFFMIFGVSPLLSDEIRLRAQRVEPQWNR